MATILSIGNLYIGTDRESFTDLNIHLGRLRIEYTCSGIKDYDGPEPSKESNRRED